MRTLAAAVTCPHVPLVKHGEVLPDDPGGAAGRVPPGHPGAPHQLVMGHRVGLLLSRVTSDGIG